MLFGEEIYVLHKYIDSKSTFPDQLFFLHKLDTMFIHKRHFMLLLFDMKEEVGPSVFLSQKSWPIHGFGDVV